MTQLTLLIPGLLGPWTEDLSAAQLPQTPALGKLLSRSTEQATGVKGFEPILCGVFKASNRGEELPIAALTYPVDSGHDAKDIILRADPVHIRAEMYQLILHEAGPIDLAEAKAFCEAFNSAFKGTGIQLETPTALHWYLRAWDTPKLSTVPINQALGKDIATLLPSGPDARHWHALLTECQMLLHEHPVNQARDDKGLPSINSIWLWGGGKLPSPQTPDFAEVYGNDVLTRGLARWAGLAVESVPDSAEDWLDISHASALTVLPALPSLDFAAWNTAIRELESAWFAPLLNSLRRKRIDKLVIEACDSRRFTVTSRDLRRFWQRSKTLSYWLSV